MTAPARHLLLVEVRTLELPPQQVWNLAREFAPRLLESLRQVGLADPESFVAVDEDGSPLLLATPRRFAACLHGVLAHTAPSDKTIVRKGPKWQACYDDSGNETPALVGFKKSLAKLAESASPAEVYEEAGYAMAKFTATQAGVSLSEHLNAALEKVLSQINAPRLMRWGSNEFKFIRPVTGLLVMCDDTALENVAVFGIAATAETSGHAPVGGERFMIPHAKEYEKVLRDKGGVLVNLQARRASIESQLREATPAAIISESLLDEVTALCESPTVYSGAFAESFLSLPAICIDSCLVKHQRAFAARRDNARDDDELSTTFYYVSNNAPQNPKAMCAGFERVVHARLQDMQFYFEEDKKLSAADAARQLHAITYHNQLGSQAQRVARIASIAAAVAGAVGLSKTQGDLLVRAANLCKCDLPTMMIGEHPELEGKMAAIYFCNGKDKDLHAVVYHHTGKLSDEPAADSDNAAASDDVVRLTHLLMLCVSVEKLVGMFGVGEKISGSQDPHGLRVCASQVASIHLRYLTEQLSLPALLDIGHAAFVGTTLPAFDTAHNETKHAIWDFIIDRRRQSLLITNDKSVLNAVLFRRPHSVYEFIAKAKAVEAILASPHAPALIALNKRIANILRKSKSEAAAQINPAHFEHDEEKKIYAALQTHGKDAAALLAAYEYETLLQNIAALTPLIDSFFEAVLVNAEDATVRQNRLALLSLLHQQLTQVADLSQLNPPAASPTAAAK